MAFYDELLVPGEQVSVHAHPHWKVLIGPVLVLLVTLGVAGYLAALLPARPAPTWAGPAIGVVALIVVVWFTLRPLIRWRTTHFVVTTRRVLMRTGLITRRGVDIPIRRINSVEFRQNLLERMLGCGTLVVESASDEPLEFEDVADVEQVHSLLYAEVANE